MTVGGFWRSNTLTLILLIMINLAIMTFGQTAWILLGILCLLGAGWLTFKQGMAAGHEACAVRSTVDTVAAEGGFGETKQDRKYAAQAWSASTGLKGMLLSALIPYAFGCLHIICTLLNVEPLILPTRIAAWVMSLPWWCVVLHWQPTFDHLTALSAAVLMITPFLLPLCGYVGYMQGPKLWSHTEEAMKQGRRRAKARSRVAKKRAPKVRGPEI